MYARVCVCLCVFVCVCVCLIQLIFIPQEASLTLISYPANDQIYILSQDSQRRWGGGGGEDGRGWESLFKV